MAEDSNRVHLLKHKKFAIFAGYPQRTRLLNPYIRKEKNIKEIDAEHEERNKGNAIRNL